MIRLRRSNDRGQTKLNWLDSRHTFSFGDYYDPKHMGFSHLRVINEDRVVPGAGFPTHSHRDMEIITYVLEGALAHKDSTGTSSVIRVGDVQRMSAGTGVVHSEFNASPSEGVHFLQIWLLPAERGIKPGYEQKAFSDADKRGTLKLVASPDGSDGSITIHTDARVYAGVFGNAERAEIPIAKERGAWVHVARGNVKVNDQVLHEGDGVAIEGEPVVRVDGIDEGEVIVFDLA
jgi:quercetin 2,3-dioxygenase